MRMRRPVLAVHAAVIIPHSALIMFMLRDGCVHGYRFRGTSLGIIVCVHITCDSFQLVVLHLVQCCLEVVEDDGVGHTFEDER